MDGFTELTTSRALSLIRWKARLDVFVGELLYVELHFFRQLSLQSPAPQQEAQYSAKLTNPAHSCLVLRLAGAPAWLPQLLDGIRLPPVGAADVLRA